MRILTGDTVILFRRKTGLAIVPALDNVLGNTRQGEAGEVSHRILTLQGRGKSIRELVNQYNRFTSFPPHDIVLLVIAMGKPNIKKAKRHLTKLRQLVSQKAHRFRNMSEEDVIKAIRETREEIWDKKLAARP